MGQTPQLVMRRPHLKDLPTMALPVGHGVRCYRPGDEAAWEAIIGESFGSEHSFAETMQAAPCFLPERVWFVTCGEVPVATASAWKVPRYGPDTGMVHMVGALTQHTGKRLGYWVSLATLHRFVEEGLCDAVLQTDDFRLPAIKTYLNLDFEPLLVDENQRERWREVYRVLGLPELAARHASCLSGPIHEFGAQQEG
ncbi:MAG: hypothetical protein HY318_09470 [Armatimonadetes bacterium]|nr:hypothetical protein [Armatimonadota bacterium]